ncbi:hypothetical protein cyc_08495 [Cyclospora cayetanensis]|uniref:Uncharacterized protein n=1 Tax=Cyclospora cayetanensis TaxID=88456 RepID=A0A1D3D2T6_9EIME|nr:hypothetical protein cyc_08495 [Cyclospora cayetanensis]
MASFSSVLLPLHQPAASGGQPLQQQVPYGPPVSLTPQTAKRLLQQHKEWVHAAVFTAEGLCVAATFSEPVEFQAVARAFSSRQTAISEGVEFLGCVYSVMREKRREKGGERGGEKKGERGGEKKGEKEKGGEKGREKGGRKKGRKKGRENGREKESEGERENGATLRYAPSIIICRRGNGEDTEGLALLKGLSRMGEELLLLAVYRPPTVSASAVSQMRRFFESHLGTLPTLRLPETIESLLARQRLAFTGST